MKNTKVVVPIILVLVVLLVGGFFLFRSQENGAVKSDLSNQPVQAENSTPNPSSPIKEFTIIGTSFAFNPATITVNKGDAVRITFVDEDSAHNLIVDGYNISTNIIRAGQSDTIQFVADKVGTFEYYCSVANHRVLGMTGTLVVQ